jgi:hypothetical protein
MFFLKSKTPIKVLKQLIHTSLRLDSPKASLEMHGPQHSSQGGGTTTTGPDLSG